jgi:hypothetical protein
MVNLVFGLRDHLSGLGPVALVACGSLLLGRGVDQVGQVPRCQVGQLHTKLCVLEESISQHLLLPEPDIIIPLEHLGVLCDIRTSFYLAAGANMLQDEEPTVLVALVAESKVNAGTVLRGGPHEVGHDPGDVER